MAVVSGNVTSDGRPLLWKNRDYRVVENELVYHAHGDAPGEYACLAQVNAGQKRSAWMGVNSAGLCIANTLARDLEVPPVPRGPGNGNFMLRALKTCATVNDVEELLRKTNLTGRATNANFGVIDAQGGAVVFEAGFHSYTRFDADDPSVAPHGFLVRSNFSTTGSKVTPTPSEQELNQCYSADRYLRAEQLLKPVLSSDDLTYTLLSQHARDLHRDLHKETDDLDESELPAEIDTRNTICRNTTIAFAVFQGVRPDEDPLLTTMWLGLGNPAFSVAVPCWVAMENVAPEMQGVPDSPLNATSRELKQQFYNQQQDTLQTGGLAQVCVELLELEEVHFRTSIRQLNEWREQGIQRQSMHGLHLSAAEQALAALSTLVKLRADQPVHAPIPVHQD